MKELVARATASFVGDGETIGLGSGSTVELAVVELGRRIAREKLLVFAVPSSPQIATIAEQSGVRVLHSGARAKIDWAFDGADEVDTRLNLIKGRGAALLGEKIIAKRAKGRFTVVATGDKLVQQLGYNFPVPVEVVPEAIDDCRQELVSLGAREVVIRDSKAKYGPTITDHGNYILDARFEGVTEQLAEAIKAITGVVEHGLFYRIANRVITTKGKNVVKIELGKDEKPVEEVLL